MSTTEANSQPPPEPAGPCLRLRAEVGGAVQGVGFRPFVYRLATELGLAGWVINSSQGVVVEVEGGAAKLHEFLRRLQAEKPPPCVIQRLETAFLPPAGYAAFEVRDSHAAGAKTAAILPDLATCADCLRELFDPADRRYRYPFINCTNCGPRYSILESLPYDRPRTTMKAFVMCTRCRAEFEEPICTDEREALTRLGGIADVFLVHNRPIARHVDDSVVRVVRGGELVLRRARGYAPFPVAVGQPLPPLLAVGGQQKNTVAVAVGTQVVVSQHIGDLETAPALAAFRRVAADLGQLYNLQPQAVVRDEHPDYLSSQFAEKTGLPVVRVQHHHAHVRACMAEHGLSGPLLGVAWDGTGLGTDGVIWGGEFLRIAGPGFERVAHLRAFPLPGGEKAVREPRRSALGLLYEALGDTALDREELPPVAAFTRPEQALLRTMLQRGVNSPWTTSAGRLFDAVAALIGLRQVARFEGQAAMELEHAGSSAAGEYPFDLAADGTLDWGPMVRALLTDRHHGATAADVAARFHATLAEMIVAVAQRVGERQVVLTGGCFQNARLLEEAIHRLETAGFQAFWHQRIPPNDGGLALGQVMAAVAQEKESDKPEATS